MHYAYGLVELPGTKMSKRRARFVALDEVIEQAKMKVAATMAERKETFGKTSRMRLLLPSLSGR